MRRLPRFIRIERGPFFAFRGFCCRAGFAFPLTFCSRTYFQDQCPQPSSNHLLEALKPAILPFLLPHVALHLTVCDTFVDERLCSYSKSNSDNFILITQLSFRISFYPALFSRVARLAGRSINQSNIIGWSHRRRVTNIFFGTS